MLSGEKSQSRNPPHGPPKEVRAKALVVHVVFQAAWNIAPLYRDTRVPWYHDGTPHGMTGTLFDPSFKSLEHGPGHNADPMTEAHPEGMMGISRAEVALVLKSP